MLFRNEFKVVQFGQESSQNWIDLVISFSKKRTHFVLIHYIPKKGLRLTYYWEVSIYQSLILIQIHAFEKFFVNYLIPTLSR